VVFAIDAIDGTKCVLAMCIAEILITRLVAVMVVVDKMSPSCSLINSTTFTHRERKSFKTGSALKSEQYMISKRDS
jgi:hypothetical protein